MVTLEQISSLLATFKVELKTELENNFGARFDAIDDRLDRMDSHFKGEIEGLRESIEFIKDHCATREDLRLESNRIIGIIDAERKRHNAEHAQMWTAIRKPGRSAANA